MIRQDADLELVLRWHRGTNQFDLSLAFDAPSDRFDRRDLVRDPITIDTDQLDLLADDEPEYGSSLTAMLFASQEVRRFFIECRTLVTSRRLPLHLRLLVDRQAPRRFHAVRWECLRDPDNGKPIATTPSILLSRYLTSADWRPIASPPQHDLKALVVVANPRDLASYRKSGKPLPPVDVEGELSRARKALAGMEIVDLASPGTATFDAVTKSLDQNVDVLYLVCHGAYTRDESRLLLEREDGTADEVNGRVLADRIEDLGHRPTLVVLCSCQSAGDGDTSPRSSDEGELSALGPRLAAAGVAAVIGMQGNVSMKTAERFLAEFFRSLADDGVVDRAMASARNAVREQPDWWVPVLFSRLRSGRTYYHPGFTESADDWFEALNGQIELGECTPVLGSGMGDEFLLSREVIAQRWAERWQLPMTVYSRSELATVAQYLRARTSPATPRAELRRLMIAEFRERYGSVLPKELFDTGRLPELFRQVAVLHRGLDGHDPYRLVADLRLPVYVTTSWSDLLEDALRGAGREPIAASFDWRRDRDVDGPVMFDPRDLDQPLVYHLFGRFECPDSLVLSQDDYSEWLVSWVRADARIPNAVRTALTNRSLMFLGYRLDGWEFRVLRQGIKSFPGSRRLNEYVHAAVQVRPEATPDIEPEAAQDYLQSVFPEPKLAIFFGGSSDFLVELAKRRRGSA